MSKEEKDNVFKINVPIFTNEELRRLDDMIENDIDNIINQISKTVSKDREVIFLKKVIDKLQKENKKYIDVFNSTEKIMNRQERTKDKLLKENVELQKENEILKYENKQVMETGQKAFIDKFMNNEFINKDIIRNKIKELKEESNGDDYTLINVINILKNLLGE